MVSRDSKSCSQPHMYSQCRASFRLGRHCRLQDTTQLGSYLQVLMPVTVLLGRMHCSHKDLRSKGIKGLRGCQEGPGPLP
jgi:hypothetical protein